MSILPVSNNDLKKYYNDAQIVGETAEQVIKDFSTFGFDIQFPDNLIFAYDSLFEQLAPVINELLDRNSSKLYSLLYTIDISESSIRRGISEMNGLEVHDTITHLILERELKKVLTRRYFRNNS